MERIVSDSVTNIWNMSPSQNHYHKVTNTTLSSWRMNRKKIHKRSKFGYHFSYEMIHPKKLSGAGPRTTRIFFSEIYTEI